MGSEKNILKNRDQRNGMETIRDVSSNKGFVKK